MDACQGKGEQRKEYEGEKMVGMMRVKRGCNRDWPSFFSLLLVLSVVTFLLFLASASPFAVTSVSAHSTKAPSASLSSGEVDTCSVLILVRSDFCYGVILTNSNTSAGEDTIRFTFTYNSSLPVDQEIQVYQYTTNGTLIKPPSGGVVIHYDSSGYHYVSNSSGMQLCRFYEKGIETQLDVEYVRILVETEETSEDGQVIWSSGYTVGMGATVLIHSNSDVGFNRGPLSVSTAVALTLTSLIPFFMLLPDAIKKLCHAVEETSSHTRRAGGNGQKLYVRILALFIPLLCIGIVFLSVTAMLNGLKLGV